MVKNMKKLTDEEILDLFGMISDYHSKYLEKHGVKLPNLKWRGNYTKGALTLVYLAQGYPHTSVVTKDELTEFIRQYESKANDVQQARHLGAQKGWFILSGTRKDNVPGGISEGEYKLKTLEKPYPGFTAERRENSVGEHDWEKIKKKYNSQCACCGSKEGEPHRYWSNTITVLQKGHMDPNKPLETGNIIPQCEKCNQPDKNFWVYDKKGRVVGIANAKVVDKCSKELKKEIYTRLYKVFDGKDPKDIR